MNSTTVSVCIITYNHEKYIRDAIEGVLMQKIDFPLEIVIADDFSTDNTRTILHEYQQKYPDLIKLILQKENVGAVKNWWDLMTFPKSKYLALCDGDDSWIDPFKLQKQVDFLDQNEEFGLVCGGFKSKNEKTNVVDIWLKDINGNHPKYPNGFEIDADIFWNNWCIQTLTVVFRNSLFDTKAFANLKYNYPIDLHLFYFLFIQQKAFYFKEIWGIQNVTAEGIYSNKPTLDRLKTLYFARKELFERYKNDTFLKAKFFNVASELFVNKSFIREHKELNRLELFKDMLSSIQHFSEVKHLIKCLVMPRQIAKS